MFYLTPFKKLAENPRSGAAGSLVSVKKASLMCCVIWYIVALSLEEGVNPKNTYFSQIFNFFGIKLQSSRELGTASTSAPV